MAEIDLKFLGWQVALLLDGQREIKAELAAIEDRLAETATRDLMLRMLRSFEGQVEIAGIRTELLRETLESRIKATEARIGAPPYSQANVPSWTKALIRDFWVSK